jgi:hypothetical protein
VSRLDDFDQLVAEKERELDRVGTLLRAAVANISDLDAGGGYSTMALRARGAAVSASVAANELLVLAGALELAAAVSDSGLLDEDNRDD